MTDKAMRERKARREVLVSSANILTGSPGSPGSPVGPARPGFPWQNTQGEKKQYFGLFPPFVL